ncbi:MAG: cytochrome c peroxidase [Pseudomonadota bacterium]
MHEARAALGRLLFYDKILSGNRNISCGTCHHHDHAGGDGLSLGIGEGGAGVAQDRSAGEGRARIEKRVPRNAPALFNLGAREVRVLFHDGRLSRSDRYGVGFDTPAEERLPQGLSSPLAAQALFPLTSEVEMAGSPEENEVAVAAYDRIDRVWPILAKRVRTIPAYGARLVDAFDDLDHPSDATIVHVAEALAAFIDAEWRSYDSRYDLWLAGEARLSSAEHRGRRLFFGKAGCAACHGGRFFTDQAFHALALPPFGPGRTRRFDPYARDLGRMGETDLLADAYRFRTPALRNVALTAPYGHNGAYPTLEGIVRHHLDPMRALEDWRREAAALPEAPWLAARDFVAFEDRREMQRLTRRVDVGPLALSDGEIEDLVAFLGALTGGDSVKGRLGRPAAVPSGLPVD